MMSRTILHCDMNNCFASIEMLLNPELKGKAIAVCGDKEERHGIVLAKSEPAKKYGVKTGEAIWEAKQKCKDLLIVPPHYEVYSKYSEIARALYYEYTDRVEPFGLDECWLDVSESISLYGKGEEIANEIRNRMKKEIGLTVSIGVSFNKIFAKLGSDMKKPDAVTCIEEENFKNKVWNLPAGDLLFVGRRTRDKLARVGIKTIGDIANSSPKLLKRLLGKNGCLLWHYANGRDTSKVSLYGYTAPIKSIGRGITCVEDMCDDEEVLEVFMVLACDVCGALKENHLMATGVKISVKDNGLSVKQFQTRLQRPTQSAIIMAREALQLFRAKYDWEKEVRAVSVCAIGLRVDSLPCQQTLFYNERQDKEENIDKTIYSLKKKHGKTMVFPAVLLKGTKMPKDYFGSRYNSFFNMNAFAASIKE